MRQSDIITKFPIKKKLVLKPMGTTIITNSNLLKKESNDHLNNFESKSLFEEKSSESFSKTKTNPQPQSKIKQNRKINVKAMIVGAFSRKR